MHHLLYSTVFVRAGRRVGVVSDARYSAFVAQRTALERAENELRAYTLTLAKWRELLKPPYAHVPKLRMNMDEHERVDEHAPSLEYCTCTIYCTYE